MLLAVGEKFEEFIRLRAEVADTAIGGQGADVHQDAGGTLKAHGYIISAQGGNKGAKSYRFTDSPAFHRRAEASFPIGLEQNHGKCTGMESVKHHFLRKTTA